MNVAQARAATFMGGHFATAIFSWQGLRSRFVIRHSCFVIAPSLAFRIFALKFFYA
jgi:hypothetical protein